LPENKPEVPELLLSPPALLDMATIRANAHPNFGTYLMRYHRIHLLPEQNLTV
jgi:hypothetical protein